MSEKGKKGSSRRKGDEYQDLTALRFALEGYIDRKPFRMFLEYEKSGNLDDIVLVQESEIFAYQVKYAVHPLAVYEVHDFVDLQSPVSIRKFADSWVKVRELFPDHKLKACLCSNRGLDSALVNLMTADGGGFATEFIEDRKRGVPALIRSDLLKASGLDAESFKTFLTEFRFMLRQRPLPDLELYIRSTLLDKELGLTDDPIFFELKDAIKDNALYSREAITAESIDRLLEKLQSKLLIPQVFPVNHYHFVEQESLWNKLDESLPRIDGGYLVVTGLPGSGKSTSLTAYFERLDETKNEIFSYYCFVDVNDNFQKMRVQADSLRANLLSEFHRRYPHILKRRFDYGERNFLQSLETLARHFAEESRRFIIFLDGLDHAERLQPEVRDTAISALPSEIPGGVTIVVGTQELHKWPHFLKIARECPGSHIQMPLFSVSESEEYLINKRGLSDLSHPDIVEIHRKCEGLPLYLQYVAEILIASESPAGAVVSLTPALGGDIRSYYGLLWEELDRVGMGNARHLCSAMACLRFSVHRDELYRIQVALTRPEFEDAFKCMSQLLRNTDDRFTIFHNSFREFALSQIANDYSREIHGHIASFLKSNKDSPRWFGHVFQYSYEAEDYKYVLDEVNSAFVDRALVHCRPSGEILDAIHWAIESAFMCRSIVHLSRLGPLRFRTQERLKHNLDRILLADVLLSLGREQDVMSFAYSPEASHWLVDRRTALAVMANLAEEGRRGLGKQLFDIFTDDFRGIEAETNDAMKSEVVGIARCLGLYLESMPRALQWLSSVSLAPGTLEQQDPFAPGYAPHLEAYIDTLVQFGHEKKWAKLKKVKILFPNTLVRYLLIRVLARHNRLEHLRVAVSEYLAQGKRFSNVELAFYAAKAGFPPSDVAAISGTIPAPKTESPDDVSPRDPVLRLFAHSFIIVGYEENERSYEYIRSLVSKDHTLWSSALHHLLKAGRCIGKALRPNEDDWYEEALESIAILAQAEQGDGERIAESIDRIREVLPLSIGILTECVEKRYPGRLIEWVEGLKSLRESLLWTTHFGLGESRVNYEFELRLWETLARRLAVRPGLKSLLRSCADTYEVATKLKGSDRSDHFLQLASLMAKCAMREDAGKWLSYGIRSSLIYGYHKDVTLLYLIDVLKLVNQRNPNMALERCARVLSMVHWMPHLSDGRETKWFVRDAFEAVLPVNRRAAFDLLRNLSRTTARWKMQDCLELYLMSETEGDPEYLWCLTELFANHDSEDGRHCKQVMGSRQHIVDLVGQRFSDRVRHDFQDRFRNFVLTEISPRHWPEELKPEPDPKANQISKISETGKSRANPRPGYTLEGETITTEDVASRCRVSFPEFLKTIDNLKKQNKNFYEPYLIKTILRHHIAQTTVSRDLLAIKEYIESEGPWQNANVIEILAERFLEFGDKDNAIACFGLAYACHGSSFRWRHSRKYLDTVAVANRQAAETLVLNECYDSAGGTLEGCDTPPIAATGLDILGEANMLEKVFADFLNHCESMFTQLPKDDSYEWLKQYENPSRDINHFIVDFVIDELETPELDLGERLVRALIRLAIARPLETTPIILTRALGSSGRIKRRLLMVINCLATQIPESLAVYQQAIVPLLDRRDLFSRQTALKTLKLVEQASALGDSVLTSMCAVEREYSCTISYPTYRLPKNPSAEFSNFLKRHTLFDFSRQVAMLEKILHVPAGSLVSAIEEKLNAQGWSIGEELERIKDDWYAHVHPQDWPLVWITTRFQEHASEELCTILDEAAKKLKLSETQIEQLWRTIQAVDPEYMIRGLMAKPRDIPPLHVTDKEAWFGELIKLESMRLADVKTQPDNDDWITVFENRRVAQEEEYNVPYRQEMSLESFLIPQRLYGGAKALDEIDLSVECIAIPASEGAITLEQARMTLVERGGGIIVGENHQSIPLIAVHENPLTFSGYRDVCSLASFIIDEMGLLFVDFDLIKDGQKMVVHEAWQEGYQDENYSRDKLSWGTRLRVRRDFLSDICGKYKRLLCTSIDEKREHFNSIHDRYPDDARQSRRYVLFHL